jgi:hypothetical protein
MVWAGISWCSLGPIFPFRAELLRVRGGAFRDPQVISEQCLCGLVLRVPGYRFRDPGSSPGVTRFTEK